MLLSLIRLLGSRGGVYLYALNSLGIYSFREPIFFINKDMKNQATSGILQNIQPIIPKIANSQRGSLPVPPKSGPSRGIIKVKVPEIPTNLH